jgi:hypothetical protein
METIQELIKITKDSSPEDLRWHAMISLLTEIKEKENKILEILTGPVGKRIKKGKDPRDLFPTADEVLKAHEIK